jgi:hypothetical protein
MVKHILLCLIKWYDQYKPVSIVDHLYKLHKMFDAQLLCQRVCRQTGRLSGKR